MPTAALSGNKPRVRPDKCLQFATCRGGQVCETFKPGDNTLISRINDPLGGVPPAPIRAAPAQLSSAPRRDK